MSGGLHLPASPAEERRTVTVSHSEERQASVEKPEAEGLPLRRTVASDLTLKLVQTSETSKYMGQE